MPRHEAREWVPKLGAYGGRKSRQRFTYEAYVPDDIATLELQLSDGTRELARTAGEIAASLDGVVDTHRGLEVLARQLLRSEAVGSSRIEGLQMSHRRIIRASVLPDGRAARDSTARAVLGNIRAMDDAIALGERANPITRDDVVAIHSTLLTSTRDHHLAGQVRNRQVWIGGGATPRNADFIPPPHEFVEDLLIDLAAYLNRTDVDPIIQAAVAHVQFESIHPFPDGNGRTGRCLIHTVLRRTGAVTSFVPPVSLVLAAHGTEYVAGLTAHRDGNSDRWIDVFCRSLIAACTEGEHLAEQLEQVVDGWRASLTDVEDSVVEQVVDALPGQPIVSATSMVDGTGLPPDVAAELMATMVARGRVASRGEWHRSPTSITPRGHMTWNDGYRCVS